MHNCPCLGKSKRRRGELDDDIELQFSVVGLNDLIDGKFGPGRFLFFFTYFHMFFSPIASPCMGLQPGVTLILTLQGTP